MDNRYSRIINALVTNDFINEIATLTGVDNEKVKHLLVEVVARMVGDGTDLNKANIEHRIKTIVKSDDLKSLLHRLSEKYEISLADASKILAELLPILFRKVHALDDSYFKEEGVKLEVKDVMEEKPLPKQEGPRHKVQYAKIEETKQGEKETTVDDVFSNIEKRANQDEKKYNIDFENKKVRKTKKSLFNKNNEKLPKEVAIGNVDNKELSIIEKICILVVLVAFLALVGTIIFLFLKQKL